MTTGLCHWKLEKWKFKYPGTRRRTGMSRHVGTLQVFWKTDQKEGQGTEAKLEARC